MNAFEIEALLNTEPTTRDRIGEPYGMRPGKRREITSQWVVGPGNTRPNDDRFGDEGSIVLDLDTFHHGDRKQYTSVLRVSIEGQNMKQTVIAFGARGEAVNVHGKAVDRFSAKSMREHHAHALKCVEASAYHCGMTLAAGVAQYLPTELTAEAS